MEGPAVKELSRIKNLVFNVRSTDLRGCPWCGTVSVWWEDKSKSCDECQVFCCASCCAKYKNIRSCAQGTCRKRVCRDCSIWCIVPNCKQAWCVDCADKAVTNEKYLDEIWKKIEGYAPERCLNCGDFICFEHEEEHQHICKK